MIKILLITLGSILLFGGTYILMTYMDIHFAVMSKTVATMSISALIIMRFNRVRLIK